MSWPVVVEAVPPGQLLSLLSFLYPALAAEDSRFISCSIMQ